MPLARPILVTRPAAAGQALSAALAARGADVRWLPAFDLGPAPDAAAARLALAQLGSYDLALFVSPAAVRATAQLLGDRAWPPGTTIGAVGAGTRVAVAAELHLASDALPPVIAPAPANGGERGAEPGGGDAEPDAASGSEAYWQAQRAHDAATGTAPRQVLILRAEQGREWLSARFAQAGATVTSLAVYTRRARAWSAPDAAWVAQRTAGVAPVLVITSSEAVDRLVAAATAADASGRALHWLRQGRVLALHPRIVARLQAAGFAHASVAPCEVEPVLAAAAAPG